jgi:hypothetical protein
VRRVLLLSVLLLLAPAWAAQSSGDPAAGRMERKLRHLAQNAARKPPDPAPSALTEEEVNAYFADGRIPLPAGVKRVRFRGTPGVITATARVDFDELTAGRRAQHPLLLLFTGRHDVTVVAQAEGSEGEGVVTVESVAINGRRVPRQALEFFLSRYVTPRYPSVGMESRFPMPARIATATVEEARLVVVQK